MEIGQSEFHDAAFVSLARNLQPRVDFAKKTMQDVPRMIGMVGMAQAVEFSTVLVIQPCLLQGSIKVHQKLLKSTSSE